jgi:alpha-L-fucosidase 2
LAKRKAAAAASNVWGPVDPGTDCDLITGLGGSEILAFAQGCPAVVAGPDDGAASSSSRYLVTLQKPTDEWLKGFPLANGASAAMVHGTPSKVVLSLNHVDFWRYHGSQDADLSAYKSVVDEVRRLMMQGKTKEANELASKGLTMRTRPRDFESLYSNPGLFTVGHTNSFQPLGNLIVEIDGQSKVSGYRRTLDLQNGIVNVHYQNHGDVMRQEYYVPAAEDVLVVRFAAAKPFSGRVYFSRTPQTDYQWNAVARNDRLLVTGRFKEGVVSAVLTKVETSAGKLVTGQNPQSVKFSDTEELRLFVAVEAGREPYGPAAACTKKTKTISRKSLESVRAAHCQEHRSMFDRADLVLGKAPRSSSTDSDVLVAQAVNKTYENELAEKVFQMGRYLMMSCNRAGRRPANLQGIWNANNEPLFDCDWHFDINVQMSHWLVNPTNLDECNMALFRQVEQFEGRAKTLAKTLTGCRGVLYPIVLGGDGGNWLPGDWFWTGAAGWIGQHFWRHYEYTLDRAFLAEHAYPFLKQVGLFYRDYLIKNKAGKYVTATGFSPENRPHDGYRLNIHCTMDTAIVREVMRHLLEGGKILGVDQDLWPVWQDLHDNVLPYPVSKEGVLKEWPAPLEEEPKHRHFSHLYPLFPGDEFTLEATPKLFAAARGAVALRESPGLGENAGWSYPYMACFYARLGDGDKALQDLHYLAKAVTRDNLLTTHNDWRKQGLTVYWGGCEFLFQIEAALGASAAISEMLLQSHGGLIRVLPALPAKWSTGRFRGLKARGAFVVEAAWEDGKLHDLGIKSLKGTPCTIRCCTPWKSVDVINITKGKQSVEHATDARSQTVSFATEAGNRYQLQFN